MITNDMYRDRSYPENQELAYAIYTAIKENRVAELKSLLNPGLPLLANTEGSTFLHQAIFSGNAEIVNLILSNQQTDVNAQKFGQYTALFMAVDFAGWGSEYLQKYLPIINSLSVIQKLDINLTDAKGNAALHIAVIGTTSKEILQKKPSAEIVKMLLRRRDININSLNNDKEHPLTISIVNNSLEIANLLLNDPRIDLEICGESALLEAGKKIAYYSDRIVLERAIHEKIYQITTITKTTKIFQKTTIRNKKVYNKLTELQIQEQLTIKFLSLTVKWKAFSKKLINKGVDPQPVLASVDQRSPIYEFLDRIAPVWELEKELS